jgi:hypothetical protein
MICLISIINRKKKKIIIGSNIHIHNIVDNIPYNTKEKMMNNIDNEQ